MSTTVVVKLPRESPEARPITQLCENNFGTADWNDSGKGNRFGILRCEFGNIRNVAAFLLELLQRGFVLNVEARR